MRIQQFLPLFLLFFVVAFPLHAQTEAEAGDKTEAPRFEVKTSGGKIIDNLPLKQTTVDVHIAGVMADVRVTQLYKNEGTEPLEATYVFPASAHAAVYSMQMTIGERKIIAEIREKEKAREKYNAAKEDGKTASLLEEQRPNVFSMQVANILPGDEIRVEFRYAENLVPVNGEYEFWFPAVFGDDYYEELPPLSAGLENNYITHGSAYYGKEPILKFAVNVHLNAGMPISKIECISHATKIMQEDKIAAYISPDYAAGFKGNKAYQLKYRLAGPGMKSGLLLYEGEEENFFLAMVQPPSKIKMDVIPPREYVFIVDVSGSMHGWPMEVVKELMRRLTGVLRPVDMFNVVLFAGGSEIFSETSVPATLENISQAMRLVDTQTGGGSTDFLSALRKSFSLPSENGYSRSFIILTDGFVTVEREAFDIIRKKLGEANCFAFGIGDNVNKFLIEGLARCGMGEPYFVTKDGQAEKEVERFARYCGTPLMTDIKANFNGLTTYDIEPLALPDLMSERPILFFGKYRGKPDGKLVLQGTMPKGKFEEILNLSDYTPSENNKSLMYLWARHRVGTLGDYYSLENNPDSEVAAKITELGLKYSLLTQFTSFVAVDSEIRNTGSLVEATMNSYGATPEPHEWLLIGLIAAMGGWILWKRYLNGRLHV